MIRTKPLPYILLKFCLLIHRYILHILINHIVELRKSSIYYLKIILLLKMWKFKSKMPINKYFLIFYVRLKNKRINYINPI